MNGLVGFVLCGLVLTGVSRNPLSAKEYNPACGLKSGLPRAEFDSFNPLDDEWPLNVKCYHQCELEQLGAFENGELSEQFKAQLSLLKLVPSEELQGLTTFLLECVDDAKGEGECEKAYQFGKCLNNSVLGAAALGALAGFTGVE